MALISVHDTILTIVESNNAGFEGDLWALRLIDLFEDFEFYLIQTHLIQIDLDYNQVRFLGIVHVYSAFCIQ